MIDDLLFSRGMLVALALIGLAFAMVTCTLYTLAMRRHRAIQLHNLIRDTRLMRNQYLASQAEKSSRH